MTRVPRSRAQVLCAALMTGALLAGSAACSGPEPTPPPSEPTTTRTTATPTPAPATRASGLMWDSGSNGHKAEQNTAFAQSRGKPLDVIGVAPTRDTWKDVLGDWWLSSDTIPADFTGTLNVAAPLIPDDGDLAEAARGEYDHHWRKLGSMIAKKYPTAYVRPGWEMNIHNWKWSANPDNVEEYKQAFRRASTALKQSGPQLRIVWNVNEGKGDTLPDARMAYPGDDVVDIVGVDAYDWSPPYDAKGWRTHRDKDQGWDFWAKFAREHGKKLAFPEWGVIAGNENSGGDNPAFIDYAYEWMRENVDIMAFESYFDEDADYCRCALTVNPKSQAAYNAWMPRLVAPKS